MRSHTEVAKVWREPKKHERNRNPIAVAVDDRRFAVSIGFPIAALKIDSEGVRRDLTQYLVRREFTSDENHDVKSEREIQ